MIKSDLKDMSNKKLLPRNIRLLITKTWSIIPNGEETSDVFIGMIKDFN